MTVLSVDTVKVAEVGNFPKTRLGEVEVISVGEIGVGEGVLRGDLNEVGPCTI